MERGEREVEKSKYRACLNHAGERKERVEREIEERE